MTQKLVDFTCQICGGALEEKSGGVFVCRYCGKRWEKETVDDHEKIFETVDSALRDRRRADLAALTRRRYEEVHKEFVSNMELERICNRILDLNPDDFYAEFYLATCKEDSSLEKFLSSMDIAAHYYDIEDMLAYLIRGLQARWINAVSTLIENAYKNRDLEKYNLYRTRFEEMADNVDNGIFEPTLPRDVFIAYSSADMSKVNELLRVLEGENGLSCFVAARNLRHGSGAVENYRKAIQTALRNCGTVVFVSSASSRNSRCEATRELDYIKENLPEMRRIEFLTENYKGLAVERIFTSFFEGLEYCTTPQQVAERYFDRRTAEKPAHEEAPVQMPAAALPEFEIENGVLKKYNGNAENIFIPESVTSIAAQAFCKCESAVIVNIPASVETVGAYIFQDCKNLKTIYCEETEQPEGWNVKYLGDCKAPIGWGSKFSDFAIENGVLTKYNGASGFVVIPHGVTSIDGKAFESYNGPLFKVTIPESVTYIGDGAFEEKKDLRTVIIPNGVSAIGDRTFRNSGLQDIDIPESVTSIGDGAFEACRELHDVYIPESVTSIGENAFYLCSELEEITIPQSVESIGENAFAFCEALKNIYCKAKRKARGWHRKWLGSSAKVVWGCPDFIVKSGVLKKYNGTSARAVIPNNVTSIGENAFHFCNGLQSLTVSGRVTSIGERAFSDCRHLTNITMPNSITTISKSAFAGCKSLTNIAIPSGVTTIEEDVFYECKSLASITIPKGVTSIGTMAFEECASLADITIPDSVTTIGERAFYLCESLARIRIPSSVTAIGEEAFAHCFLLNSISIPASVTSIGSDAFCDCRSLTSVSLPKSITSIGENTFLSCNSLKEITIPKSVTEIGEEAFGYCESLTSITIPSGVTSIDEAMFFCCSNLTSITIPNSVTTIGTMAFDGCRSITSITLPESLKSIENDLFAGCVNLKSVNIPKGVKSIGLSAFEYCESLTKIDIPNGVTSIGWRAFKDCAVLQSVTIPNNVTSIGEEAFSGCNGLTSITIPNGVTYIGKKGFANCEKLKTIYCKAAKQPAGWAGEWLEGCRAEVVWGYKG